MIWGLSAAAGTLHHAGAHVQRPLWASTGVKNPRYPDTMYVDGLVAPHTVNTMPLATLEAAADHAKVSGPTATHNPDDLTTGGPCRFCCNSCWWACHRPTSAAKLRASSRLSNFCTAVMFPASSVRATW